MRPFDSLDLIEYEFIYQSVYESFHKYFYESIQEHYCESMNLSITFLVIFLRILLGIYSWIFLGICLWNYLSIYCETFCFLNNLNQLIFIERACCKDIHSETKKMYYFMNKLRTSEHHMTLFSTVGRVFNAGWRLIACAEEKKKNQKRHKGNNFNWKHSFKHKSKWYS